MKNLLLASLIIFCNLAVAETVTGKLTYSGTCQDVGYNADGQNTLVNCTSGTLSAPGCTFINKGAGVLRVSCGNSQYIYSCSASSSYNGNWYESKPNSYKCAT